MTSRNLPTLKGMQPCADCKHPTLCAQFSRWCDFPESTKELARKAIEFQKNDTRTQEEKIADGVRFITDTRIGGE